MSDYAKVEHLKLARKDPLNGKSPGLWPGCRVGKPTTQQLSQAVSRVLPLAHTRKTEAKDFEVTRAHWCWRRARKQRLKWLDGCFTLGFDDSQPCETRFEIELIKKERIKMRASLGLKPKSAFAEVWRRLIA